MWVWIPLIVFVGVTGVFVGFYGCLLRKKHESEISFSHLRRGLEQRYTLVSELISSVTMFLPDQKGLLTELSRLRSVAVSRGKKSDDERVFIDNKISRDMGRLHEIVSHYRPILTSQRYLQLSESLRSEERSLDDSKRSYNEVTECYNRALTEIPTRLLAGMMGLKARKLFQFHQVDWGPNQKKELFSSNQLHIKA